MLSGMMSLSVAAGFCRRMGVGLRAGADIVKLLEAESKYGSGRHRDSLAYVIENVKAGHQMSEAMNMRRNYFRRLMISLTKVGESTGKLESTFLTLAKHYEQQVSLRKQFVTSIIWPVLQLVVGLGVISLFIYLMGILQPATGGQMEDMLGFGLRGGEGVLIFWGYIAVVAAVIWVCYMAFSRNFMGVQNIVPLFYLIPKLGPALQTITLSRFTRTLALGLGTGLDPIRSVKLALDSTDSEYYRSGGAIFESAVRDRGDTMAGGLRSTNLFPEMFLHLVEVSEVSGTESESIDHLADQYEEQASMAMKTISGVCTGVIWLMVAGTLIFLILRLAFKIFGAYDDALQGI